MNKKETIFVPELVLDLTMSKILEIKKIIMTSVNILIGRRMSLPSSGIITGISKAVIKKLGLHLKT